MNRTTIHTRHFCRLYLLFFALCLAGAVTAQGTIYYVSPTGKGDGSAWDKTTTLANALNNAKANDQIWVQGFEQITVAGQLYIAPTAGFTLKSGVQLYGGFKGDEASIDDRETLGKPYQLKYRSVLSGDIDGNDIVDNTNLIYPANTTRTDNATHVLSLDMDPAKSGNNNTYPTVVNGLTIAGGHADGTDEKGGGIYVHSDNTAGGNYRIERCFFYNNYATQGGAIYVAVKNVNNGESLISQCAVYNNVAGQRTTQNNSGGGIYLAGAGTIVNCAIFNNENGGVCLSANAKIINSTVTRNSGGGVDMLAQPNTTDYNVYNTVIWGNSELYSLFKPNFKNSAFYEAVNGNADNNIHINQYNNEGNSPFFSSPSVRATFDREYQWTNTAYPLWSWDLTEQSALIDKGDNNFYISATFGDKDMSGNTRTNGTIDIGAHEFQPVAGTRIRYVMQKAQGTGDGTSWANASGNLQQMINNLADNNPQNMPGEVWVAAGTYTPQSQVLSGTTYSASFRMRDGISVYGGFAGTETSKQERTKGTMPWEFTNRTILEATYYNHDNLSWNTTDTKWTLTSDSRHVVWFAPLPTEGKMGFENTTRLNGVVIRGGYAQGGIGTTEFLTDRGAGIYVGANAYVENCIVTENTATGNGGGIYLKGGRVKNSLLYNNNADGNGGGIYVENGGLVLASMVSNNSADNGAGVYLDHTETWSDGNEHPEYLLLSTSVISNNTSRLNGAVYCNKGGVVLQTTITNNNCPTATDNTNITASQTGGLYINQYGLIINSVIWNNIIQGKNIPMYAQNPTTDKVRFLYTAASGISNAVWNNTLQQEMISLSEENKSTTEGVIDPEFDTSGTTNITDGNIQTTVGVQGGWKLNNTTDGIDFYWKPMTGSNLRAKGMVLGSLPDEIVLKPEIDIESKLFAQKPATGAFQIEATQIQYETTTDALIVYVDVNCTEPNHNGQSWATAYRSLNEAIAYLAGLPTETVKGRHLEIHVLEGDLYPQYAFADLDPKSATIDIPTIASGAELRIYGGYRRDAANTNTVTRAPMLYRSIINGNYEAKDLADGIYHCITIAKGATVLIDGFHVINGYAVDEAPLPYGAGLLAQSGATVTLQNCIFENHTAQEGAAIDARDATLTLNNCVVNNNTNTTETAAVINCPNLTMNHVTVVNNVGAAPAGMGNSSFSAGNSSNNTQTLASAGEAGAKNFANPTNAAGATLGFDTYLGGYSEFKPQTSSTDAANLINKATGTPAEITTDIAGNPRNLGGVPDLGAYEADLPESGRVYYVRTNGDDNNTGLSWDQAFATIRKAVETANVGTVINGEKPQVWVAAGTYTQTPKTGSDNCFEILDGVNVYGAFPKTGNPGMEERHPFISTSVFNNYQGIYSPDDYETILKPNTNTGNRRVLGQTDNYNPVDKDNHDDFLYETIWDGFTLTEGYVDSDNLTHVTGGYARDGGGGARIFAKTTLRNCVIVNNTNNATTGQYTQTRGGGVYCDEGTVVNCYILKNILGKNNQYTAYGGGCYMFNGTAYNCVISENVTNGQHGDGAGIFIENGAFYNNTIVKNTSNATTRGNGGISIWTSGEKAQLTIYNCIVLGNSDRKGNMIGSGDIAVSETGGYINCNYTITSKIQNESQGDKMKITYNESIRKTTAIFADYANGNYRLGSMDGANIGLDAPTVNGNIIDLSEYTDMDFTDRIKDCRVDAGAFELDNKTNIGYETFKEADGTKSYIYYVTQNGAGLRSGNSAGNAACTMKLQQILTAAGTTATTITDGQVYVRIAGYEEPNPFIYHANTLGNPNDPQSYTYVVPEGIIVEGGYNEDFTDRKPNIHKTILSAVANTAAQDVTGYHAVTFGAWPGTAALTKPTIIDGLYLQDGSATSMAGTGNPNTRGGGAIVPGGAHVRNCVVMNCAAIEGGGLYVLPGATVSGTAILENSAENGGGIYADNTGVGTDNRAHILSCTIANNEASSTGGGICLEDGAVMVLNSVFWGNSAPSNRNISGQVSETYEDALWEAAFGLTGKVFYPFNNCYVETYEMPTNFENTSMTSDENIYFANADRTLKVYSPLIKHGTITTYYEELQKKANVATTDMQGISRIQAAATRVDVGAYAFNGGVMPTDRLVTRIFVSKGTNITLPDNIVIDDYIGRSFYTAVASIDDALEYIRVVRGNGTAPDDITFEILVAAGTYKPSIQRINTTIDQRLNTFVVPQGVSIYGGFSGTELISSKADGQGNITTIPNVIGTFECNGPISNILAKRPYSDFNQNSIFEPWELAHQTILSGEVNVSEDTRNAYHVLYSDAGTNPTTVNPITLDGLTVMNGETSNVLSNVADKDEQGRGGGIYSNGVSYLANRCRFLNNFAVRGGAIYMRDAKLTLIGSILGGNGTVDNPTTVGGEYQPPRGGAVYIAGVTKEAFLNAINTLWVNNETSGQGGAIGTNFADGITTAAVPHISLMNNTFVRNKAGDKNPVIYHHNTKNTITNTVMWGNEGTNDPVTDETNTSITHSASDMVDLTGNNNIKLSTENMAADGPRFAKPSTAAGVAGYSANSLWNPAAISVLTDAGNGVKAFLDNNISGAYEDWWTTELSTYKNQYMLNSDETDYLRYAGPLDDDGKEQDKTIDIGVYEYQYQLHLDIIYVATIESGKGDGSSWANATSDLRGAIISMANPTGGQKTEKKVYIQAGEYSLSKLSAGAPYTLSMSGTENTNGTSLEIRGSFNGSGVQVLSQPTIITTHTSNVDDTETLLNVETNAKPVLIEGITFINKNTNGGNGISATTATNGKLTLKNVAFRGNKKSGLEIVSGTDGEFLLVNTLFADGGTGLSGADSRTTVVNATFANNATDYTFTETPAIYNSVAWKNDTQHLTTDATNHNVAIDGTVPNDNLENGPNFRDPNNTDIYSRDYSLRPSVKLLNKGSNDHYIDYALELTADDAVIPTGQAGEKDLGNNERLIDTHIDVGAYEYEAPLQQIIYVKADLTGTADGKSWDTALGDLQGAVDLAGLYAKNNSGSNGYVFVHGNYHDIGLLNLTLGNVKVYGSMNDEQSAEKTDTKIIVSDLLTQRKGMLEATERSSLENVTIDADGVIDGFEVTGTATINAGALATSIVKNNIGGKVEGLLYNSFVNGSVNTVQAVNVTATGTIADVVGSGNNRAPVTDQDTNKYVIGDYWKYQLMETDNGNLDKGTNTTTQACIDKVGHERDLIGNKRIRNTVDNGCFETWNITADAEVTNDDYPRGKSVVYVRKEQELKINNKIYPDAATAFTPGFLLLEHQAGLRGNGNHISLTNFAVEREIPAGGADLVAMPFDVNTATSNLAGIKPQRYNGSTRAAYTYKYDAANSTAWTDQNLDLAGMYEGLLFDNTTGAGQTLRFYGKSTAPYIEDGMDKSISLQKYNFNEAWTTDANGNVTPSTSNKFTHKENMSWNLFGSPYLCAMNYSDLEYGRVLYGYNGGYKTAKTYNSNDGSTVVGYIPAGNAVFTQSATLKDTETFTVKQPTNSKTGTAFETTNRMAIYVDYTKTTASKATADYCSFNAVPAAEASNSFDLGSDGVKWLADNGKPQIYAIRNGGRYSLLSAVNEEAETEIGLLLPEAGNYVIGIGEGSERQEYEAVILIDRLNGTTTDLLDKDYTFSASEGGILDDRFRITFNPEANSGLHGGPVVRIYPEGKVLVSGITDGEYVSAYNAAGMLIQRLPVTENHVWFKLQKGFYLFNIHYANDTDKALKAIVP